MAKAARPIPNGYHTITANLIVDDGARALKFYATAFGAQFNDESICFCPQTNKIMHAELKIGDSFLHLADEFPQMGTKSPKNYGGTPVSLYLYVDDVDKSLKQAVDAGCEIEMPATDMFWGDRFASLKDPFGHQWALASRVEELDQTEINKRKEEFFKQTAAAGAK